MMIMKRLVEEKLHKNSSLYIEAISTILSSIYFEIDLKMFNKIQILSFHNFFSKSRFLKLVLACFNLDLI